MHIRPFNENYEGNEGFPPNSDIMSEHSYHVYCCAWCAIVDCHLEYSYPEYQYASAHGIVFG